MITRIANEGDLPEIIKLQERNLFDKLSEKEKQNGFVTTPFTRQQLTDLIESDGLFVLEKSDQVKGYTMANGWDYFSQWPIFPFMIARYEGEIFAGTLITQANTFQYGPVCIDSSLRGTDAFPRLFEIMRLTLANRYPVGITFINQVNERSYQAHIKRLKMQVIDEFEFSGRYYYGLAFDTSISVLTN
ncbi:hypothetical protein [Aliikangiella sp. IMCC44359]|uniref:hypothetical protein n=1 Tax=Aliikangiella sp. IMCC44359 TaxID=3459125 RepID=UPI00403B22EB